MLALAIAQFTYYKQLADKTISLLTIDQLSSQVDGENSIAHIIQHMAGNMKSRWTNIFTEDGEKPWRNRDSEFAEKTWTKDEIVDEWNAGWQVLFDTLNSLNENEDLSKIIYIRNDGLKVSDAILRQLCHYSYHVGQIVFRGKQIIGDASWQSLSIPKNQSNTYNNTKFGQAKEERSYLDDLIEKE